MTLKTIVQGFGVASLVLILRVWPHLSSYHPIIYHSYLPMRSVIWGVLIDVAIVSLLAALLFRYLEKSESGWRTVVWAFVAAELASTLVAAGSAMHRAPLPHLTPDAAYTTILLASLVLRWLWPPYYRHAVRVFGVLLLLAGCSMFWMIPELLYQGLRAQRSDAFARTAPLLPVPTEVAAGTGRIVWLLFDELSYDQTFDHRFPGLAMPAFDQFKHQSVIFTALQPAGYYTDRVIPALLLGKPVDNLRSNLDGAALVRVAGNKQWQPFDAHATLFADAQRLGWTTGVVGWYNPYCRILAGTLDYCFWRMGDGQSDGAVPERSALENAAAPLMETMRELEHRPTFPLERHAQDMAALMPQAEALLRDQSIRLVFIHLPAPHPPVIYDRHPGHLRPVGSYIDNLALADRSLGELITTLSGTPLAQKTTVIVCSDHSWRIPMWRSTSVWSTEDEAASHGIFDPRPVLLIHFPGQQAEHDVTAPFKELRLHDIIEHLLQGQDTGFDHTP
jgi:Sulfatase